VTPLQEQFEILKSEYPEASIQQLPSGAALIVIPSFSLPKGWSQDKTTIKFIAPVGYPFAKPDCFWVDQNVRLQNQTMPQSSGLNAIPEVGGNHLWFSWHVGQWNPNRDNLSTYVRVIEERLKDPR
jgi:E2/UBC family protein E